MFLCNFVFFKPESNFPSNPSSSSCAPLKKHLFRPLSFGEWVQHIPFFCVTSILGFKATTGVQEVHLHKLLTLYIFWTTLLSFWGPHGPRRLQTSKFFCNRGWGLKRRVLALHNSFYPPDLKNNFLKVFGDMSTKNDKVNVFRVYIFRGRGLLRKMNGLHFFRHWILDVLPYGKTVHARPRGQIYYRFPFEG